MTGSLIMATALCKSVRSALPTIVWVPSLIHCPISPRAAEVHDNVMIHNDIMMIHKATKANSICEHGIVHPLCGVTTEVCYTSDKLFCMKLTILAWRRHILSCSALRSLHVALHPSACGISNVHYSVHYKVDAMAQATGIYGKNTTAYTLLSGHVKSAAYMLPYLCI